MKNRWIEADAQTNADPDASCQQPDRTPAEGHEYDVSTSTNMLNNADEAGFAWASAWRVGTGLWRRRGSCNGRRGRWCAADAAGEYQRCVVNQMRPLICALTVSELLIPVAAAGARNAYLLLLEVGINLNGKGHHQGASRYYLPAAVGGALNAMAGKLGLCRRDDAGRDGSAFDYAAGLIGQS